MKKTMMVAVIALTSIISPMSRVAKANPYQDAYNVINYCSYHAQNQIQYQACLHQGAQLIQEKYGSSPTYNRSNTGGYYVTPEGSGQTNSNGSWTHYDRDYGSVGGDGNGCYYAFGWSNC